MSIQQVKTTSVSLQHVMSRKPFVRGFNDVHAGKPMDYDAYQALNDQWQYERGRLFGLIYTGKLKDGQRVRLEAQRAFNLAAREGSIL